MLPYKALHYIDSKLEVIIPTLNEENTISEIIKRTLQYTDRIIVVDGNSNDNTVNIAKNLGVNVILQNGCGKGDALREAFKHITGDHVIILDADGSMRPEEIPLFIKALNSGADVVKGSRQLFKAESYDLTVIRRFGNFIFVILVNILYHTKFTDLCYGYMAFKRESIKKILPVLNSTGFSIETEIIIKAKKLGLKIIEVPSLELKRRHGVSKLNTILDGAKILMTIISGMFFTSKN